MNHLICALESTTQAYILPAHAKKTSTYMCPECKREVIPRQGEIRRAHYAHKTTQNPCFYFDRPNESQQHKIAKILLASYLNSGKSILVSSKCCNQTVHYESIRLLEGDTVILEYRDIEGKYVADLAIINNGVPRIILEVFHTHKTTSCVRPEPWYEFNTTDIFAQSFHIQCCRVRTEPCEICKLRKLELGAIDKLSGGFVFPTKDYECNDLLCLSCNEPVRYIETYTERGFCHKKPSVCSMYTKPTRDQITKNTILKLASYLRDKRLMSVFYGCRSTFFWGQCQNECEYAIEYDDSQQIVYNITKGYVRVKKNNNIQYNFQITTGDDDRMEDNTFLITYDPTFNFIRLGGGKESIVFLDVRYSGFCEVCSIMETHKQQLARLPKLLADDERKCIQCCELFGHRSILVDDYYRPLCYECANDLDVEKLLQYKPTPMFVEE